MLESEIQRWINEIEEMLIENNDIVDTPEYRRAFLLLTLARDKLKESLEELDGI